MATWMMENEEKLFSGWRGKKQTSRHTRTSRGGDCGNGERGLWTIGEGEIAGGR